MPTDAKPKPVKTDADAKQNAVDTAKVLAQKSGMTKPDQPVVERQSDKNSINMAKPSMLKNRHRMIFLSFVAMFIAPVFIVILYLNAIAADQYSSEMSFSVRSEELQNPLDALSSFGQLSSGTSSDADILNEYIRSQKIVRAIEEKTNLREVYSEPDYDPVFSINSDVSIEELVEFWRSMVQVTYNKGSGLIKIESFAFSAKDALEINNLILSESQNLVDNLTLAARKDAIRYAKSDLQEASNRLKTARRKLSEFRATSKLIDPTLRVESQGGITTALQQQLAEALIQRALLLSSISTSEDPRLDRSEKLIQAIRARIKEESENLTSSVDSNLVNVVSEFEALMVDREFAEKAYLAAFAAFDSAKIAANRRTKYLAVHIEPTIAETAQYPRRLLIIMATMGLLFLGWAIFMMVFYSFRDRR